MAKKTNDPKAATMARIQRTEAYAERVRQLFAATVNQILALNKKLPTLQPGVMFSFDDQSKKMQTEVERLLRQLHSVATMAIQQGVQLEWSLANAEADKLVNNMFGKEALSSPEFSAWTNRNASAMNAFINRSEKGLNLSSRVWQSVKQLRDEMEVAITVSIGEGESAASMSRKVRNYLNEPDLMFRRFRYKKGEEDITDEDGNVIGKKPIYAKKWKKREKQPDGTYKWIDYDRDSYKTGAGVYKSSAKNAMRLTRTETNIAYRRADQERWSQMDFVLGQRVQMSRNHPKKDICDKLAGDYPKDFVFDGWHPQCFCFVTPITIPPEETAHLTEMMLNGEDWRSELKRLKRGREITSYPQNFKDWVTDHADQINAARNTGTEPYFIRNNATAIDNILNPKAKLTTQEIAAQRHANRTPEQEEAIKLRWQERKNQQQANNNVVNTQQIENVEQLSASIPDVTFTADNKKASYSVRYENMKRALLYYYSDDSMYSKLMRDRIQNFDQTITNVSSEKYLNLLCKSHLEFFKKIGATGNDFKSAMMPAMMHINEIKTVQLSQIDPVFRSEYNTIIQRINAADYPNCGFAAIYNDVEHAYNILQLSKSKEVLAFGIDKVSSKMPYNLLTEYKKKLPNYSLENGTVGKKEFWDSLSRFTPLVNVSGEKGAYFTPTYKFVHISLGKDYVARLEKSPAYQEGLLYHEFGHAWDDMHSIRDDAKLKKLYDSFVAEVKVDNGVALENKMNKVMDDYMLALNNKLNEISDRIFGDMDTENMSSKELWAILKANKEYTDYEKQMVTLQGDMEELVGGFSDSLHAAIGGTRWIAPRGHPGKYFKKYESQCAEFIAHMSENYWQGNEFFKKIAPDLYNQMRNLMAQYQQQFK